MNRYFYLIFFFLIFSCSSFFKKEQHEFIYQFEKKDEIENLDFNKTISVLKKRLDILGHNYEVKRHRQNNIKIRIKAKELNTERFNKLISNQGKLEFWELYKGEAFLSFLFEYNESLIEKEQKVEDSTQRISLVDLIAGQGYKGGPIVFQAKLEDTAMVSSYLNKKEARLYYPSGCSYVKFLWGIPDSNLLPLYAAKSNRENKAPLNGESIIEANLGFGYTDRPEINIAMGKEGALKWERITEKAFIEQTSIGVTINNVVYSAPGVTTGAIKGGKSTISGDFTLEEAQDLSIIIASQKSIPKLKLLQHKILK